MRIKLLLSFDHELHLGGAKSWDQNLFDPTNALLDTATKIDVPLNFFSDVLSADRFREWDAVGFYEPYRAQIARALREKHDVQLHIHPHWLDTVFERGRFIPSRKFALGDFATDAPPNDIRSIVTRAFEFLVALCRETDPDYRCVAYRAGGYNLSPGTDQILTALYDVGIRIESSIAKGFYFRSDLSEINYRDMPPSVNWTIAPTGPLDAESDKGLLEIPIAAKPLNPLNNIGYRFKQFRHYRQIKARRYDSGGYTIHAKNTSLVDKLKDLLFPQSVLMLGFDSATHDTRDLMNILESTLNAHRDEEEVLLSAISHPKVMGAYHRDAMASFVDACRRRYGGAVEFCTYRQVYDSCGLGDQ